mgnify:CR=1 FL=1|tara:strand:- start:174 stop:308 length:135 start_codon:yes stop_codon:yes gene_type:complete
MDNEITPEMPRASPRAFTGASATAEDGRVAAGSEISQLSQIERK